MKMPAPLTDADGEVREITDADMARFRPAHEVLPATLHAALGIRRRGAQRTPTKTPTTIRLDSDVLAALRRMGRGWQTRVNALLREAVEAGRV